MQLSRLKVKGINLLHLNRKKIVYQRHPKGNDLLHIFWSLCCPVPGGYHVKRHLSWALASACVVTRNLTYSTDVRVPTPPRSIIYSRGICYMSQLATGLLRKTATAPLPDRSTSLVSSKAWWKNDIRRLWILKICVSPCWILCGAFKFQFHIYNYQWNR